MSTDLATRAVPGDVGELEQHRPALTRHCRRILGSSAEADDAVQETMIRAWRARARFDNRCPLRTWLYHIATNVCFDALRGRRRHAVAVDLGPGSQHVSVAPLDDDPAELTARRDNVRLALGTALRHLPPRQRAVVILHDVLRWKAGEVAEMLDTSVPAVNSALQRARATLHAGDVAAPSPVDPAQRRQLEHLVDAFTRRDVARLVTLVRDDTAA